MAAPNLRIDIVSDVVCPWCIVGYKQLEHALQQTGIDAAIYWHPFELNPAMSADGQNLREHLAEKYGTTPDDSRKARARLSAIGQELSFTFNYADDMRMVNTFNAHQLLHWAKVEGRQHDLKMALFAAFFTKRRNLFDIDVLADEATAIGLNGDQSRAALVDQRFADDVRTEQAFWTSRGVTGVPTMVFDQRVAVVGAQGIENYREVLEQVTDAVSA